MYFFGSLLNVIATATANGACKAEPDFFGLVPWYHYLNVGLDVHGKCTVVSFTVVNGATPSDIPLVLLAVIDDCLSEGEPHRRYAAKLGAVARALSEQREPMQAPYSPKKKEASVG